MKRLWIVAALACLVGCGSDISGTWGGDDCLYESLEFQSDGTVFVRMFGMEEVGEVEQDGDRVVIRAGGGQSIVFTRDGDTLETEILGQTMRCRKQ